MVVRLRRMAYLNLAGWPVVLLDNPDYAEYVLVRNPRDFIKFRCRGSCAKKIHSAFHGITLRSSSWNSAEVISPRIPTVTMPQNMVVTSSSSHEFQIR
jgi:hypothetical protein